MPSEISRKDEIWIGDSGLITIAGGKLTGYRKIAKMSLMYSPASLGLNRAERSDHVKRSISRYQAVISAVPDNLRLLLQKREGKV